MSNGRLTYRQLTFETLGRGLRTEQYMGEEHLVVPCVALVGDEVVYGINAEGPELVPADELQYSVPGWSGRPVLPDHPANSTSTANDPRTLELMQIGIVFNPLFVNNCLHVEAWLGKKRAKKVTGAQDVLERCERGEMVELSIGAHISLIKEKGTTNGKSWSGRWADIMPDHLAIGLNGSKGACSVETGCGANRSLSMRFSEAPRQMRAARPNEQIRQSIAFRQTTVPAPGTIPVSVPTSHNTTVPSANQRSAETMSKTRDFLRALTVPDIAHRILSRRLMSELIMGVGKQETIEHLFARNLPRLRGMANQTQAQLAADLGVTSQTISNWESSLTEPTYEAKEMAVKVLLTRALSQAETDLSLLQIRNDSSAPEIEDARKTAETIGLLHHYVSANQKAAPKDIWATAKGDDYDRLGSSPPDPHNVDLKPVPNVWEEARKLRQKRLEAEERRRK